MGHQLASAAALGLTLADASALVSSTEAATTKNFVDYLPRDRPFETSPQDNLKMLQLVEDCYRLSGWDAA